MAIWRIENAVSGVCLGTYEADTAAAALDALAREAGYHDYTAACEAAPVAKGEIVCTPVE